MTYLISLALTQVFDREQTKARQVLLIQLAPADVSNAPILLLLLAIGSVALVVTCPTP